jgi:hypothetical protein
VVGGLAQQSYQDSPADSNLSIHSIFEPQAG